MSPPNEVGPGVGTGAAPQESATTTAADPHSLDPAVVDLNGDKRMVDGVDASLWNALFAGHFRLAVPCDVCGRWLTAGASKRAGRGPRCAAKTVYS